MSAELATLCLSHTRETKTGRRVSPRENRSQKPNSYPSPPAKLTDRSTGQRRRTFVSEFFLLAGKRFYRDCLTGDALVWKKSMTRVLRWLCVSYERIRIFMSPRWKQFETVGRCAALLSLGRAEHSFVSFDRRIQIREEVWETAGRVSSRFRDRFVSSLSSFSVDEHSRGGAEEQEGGMYRGIRVGYRRTR